MILDSGLLFLGHPVNCRFIMIIIKGLDAARYIVRHWSRHLHLLLHSRL